MLDINNFEVKREVTIAGFVVAVVDFQEGYNAMPNIAILGETGQIVANELFLQMEVEQQVALLHHEKGHTVTMTDAGSATESRSMTVEEQQQAFNDYIEGMQTASAQNQYHAMELVADQYAHHMGFGLQLLKALKHLVTFPGVEVNAHMQDRFDRLESGDYSDVKTEYKIPFRGEELELNFNMSFLKKK